MKPFASAFTFALAFSLSFTSAFAKDPPAKLDIPRFSHKSHAKLPFFKAKDADSLPCAQCHSLADKTYDPVPPGKDAHQPCANTQCHGPRMSGIDLHTPTPLCKECHETAERWQASPPRLVHREAEHREFSYRINHRRHLQVPGLDKCDTCHKLTKVVTGEEVTVEVHAPGHADCAPCHGKSGSKPSLTQCNTCHLIGEPPKPRPSAAGPFRVYEKFTHDTHRLDVRTAARKPGGAGRGWSLYDRSTAQTLGCGACHTSAARAERIDDMDLLGACAMNKTCMGQCHNGKYAFGTGMNDCFLCHSKEAERATPPASHCGP